MAQQENFAAGTGTTSFCRKAFLFGRAKGNFSLSGQIVPFFDMMVLKALP